MHQWAAGGVSGYPVKHPLIGQGDFFNKFQHFLRLTSQDEFVQVFAAIAAWGVGKSSLGFQVIGQINDTSRGWFVRDEAGALQEARLFKDDAEREPVSRPLPALFPDPQRLPEHRQLVRLRPLQGARATGHRPVR